MCHASKIPEVKLTIGTCSNSNIDKRTNVLFWHINAEILYMYQIYILKQYKDTKSPLLLYQFESLSLYLVLNHSLD